MNSCATVCSCKNGIQPSSEAKLSSMCVCRFCSVSFQLSSQHGSHQCHCKPLFDTWHMLVPVRSPQLREAPQQSVLLLSQSNMYMSDTHDWQLDNHGIFCVTGTSHLSVVCVKCLRFEVRPVSLHGSVTQRRFLPRENRTFWLMCDVTQSCF